MTRVVTSEVKVANASAFTSMIMLRAFSTDTMDTVEQANQGVTGMSGCDSVTRVTKLMNRLMTSEVKVERCPMY